MTVSAAIVGASGYAGGELLRLLLGHPHVAVKAVFSDSSAGEPVSSTFPAMFGTDLRFSRWTGAACAVGCDFVFLATENGRSMTIAPDLLQAGHRVIDLSADFRLGDADLYPAWYGFEHASPDLLAEAVYGLPELHRSSIAKARIVGNPGCYTTASILALSPMLRSKVVDPGSIVIDAKSGVSGAGRYKFGLEYHFPEINESVSAYKVGGTHRHTPEIEQELTRAAGITTVVSFTPHLVPITRGLLATCHASLANGAGQSEVDAALRGAYAAEPFVRLVAGRLPATKHVVGSNTCCIAACADPRTGRVAVFSAIDNLVKGASGQAVQNMNIMAGLPETEGLPAVGGVWP